MRKRSIFGWIRVIVLNTLIYAFLFTVLQVFVLKFVPIVVTPLMVKRSIEFRKDDGFRTHKKWVPIEDINISLAKSVIASEDNLFLTHKGFDWDAIHKEIDKSRETGKRARGCSTISQQTAKNVFTLGDRNMLRKGVEAYYTVLIEKIWGKKRILEVYLNVIEMGKGIYGAEAAAQEFFGKDASRLTLDESALITAALPNPIKMNVPKPGPYMHKRQGQIVSLVPKLDYSLLENETK